MSYAKELESTARSLVAPGKGILAADESTGTIKKRFDKIKVENTEDNRRNYREMLFTTKGCEEFVSGVILFDETLRQKASDGTPLAQILTSKGIIPGIKVDKGPTKLAGSADEQITDGLDGLRARLVEYRGLGARFAKWRAVISIGDGKPSDHCLLTNAHALARYAGLCVDEGLVPIVEPEILMDGTHSIERSHEATERALHFVFDASGPAARPARADPAQAEHGALGVRVPEAGERARGRGAHHPLLQARRSRGRARDRVPLGRPERRGSQRASFGDEPHWRHPVADELLLRSRAASAGAEGLGRQAGEPRRRPEGLLPPRQVQRSRALRQVQRRHGEIRLISISPGFRLDVP